MTEEELLEYKNKIKETNRKYYSNHLSNIKVQQKKWAEKNQNRVIYSTMLKKKSAGICDEWSGINGFENFNNWYNQNVVSTLNLCRKNQNLPYSPSNCIFKDISFSSSVRNKGVRNTSGYVGVSFDKTNNRYLGFITFKSKRYMCCFSSFKEALDYRNNIIKQHNLPHKIQEYFG